MGHWTLLLKPVADAQKVGDDVYMSRLIFYAALTKASFVSRHSTPHSDRFTNKGLWRMIPVRCLLTILRVFFFVRDIGIRHLFFFIAVASRVKCHRFRPYQHYLGE